MIIENMTKEHLVEVLKIENESFTHPWSEESFKSELEKDSSVKIVALENNKVLGYAVLETILDEGSLLIIAVSPLHRKKGIAKALFNRLEEIRAQKKLSFITLEVRSSNESAIALYKKKGFETIAVRKGYYSKPVEDAVIMTKYYK